MRDYLYHSNCLACRALSYKWWIRFYVFFINKFVVIYFIDILIYSRSETDHIEHLKKVLEVLLENKLYMNLKKYCFITNNLLFFKLYC
jgi:hypothetical protein